MSRKKAFYGEGVHKCRKCGGRAPLDKEEAVYKCIVCGHEEKEQRALYHSCEEHKNEIIQDVLDTGPVKTRVKWGISESSWRYLKSRWQLRLVWSAPGFYPRGENKHPELPTFRYRWPVEVMIKWFDSYQAYLEASKK